MTPELTNPTWPMNVLLFRPSDNIEDIKAKIKPTEDVQKTYDLLKDSKDDRFANIKTGESGVTYSSKEKHFSTKHYALLFAPGKYEDLRFEIGYYVQMAGLGKSPGEVHFVGEHAGPFVEALNKDFPVTDGGTIPRNNAGLCLDTFWRSAENFRAENCQWAVSQAAPLRNVIIDGNLEFGDGEAYASGGFLANAKVGKKVNFIANQQWFSRSVEFGEDSAEGGSWNTCFSGCTGNVPSSGVVMWQGQTSNHVRTVEPKPDVRIEKPFITMKDVDGEDYYELVVPSATFNEEAVGPILDGQFKDVRSFSEVKVCKPTLPLDKNGDYTEHDDSTYNEISAEDITITEELQAALDEGKDLVLCPGIFKLSKSLIVRHNNQVILGLGLATLVAPQDGTPCIQVRARVSGVKIAGLVLEASLQLPNDAKKKKIFSWLRKEIKGKQRCLLEVGEPGINDPGRYDNPILLADIFCRVGGSNLQRKGVETDVMICIHSGNVVGDNLWLWRADHVRLGPNEQPNDPNFPFYHQVRIWEEVVEQDDCMKAEKTKIKVNECHVKNALVVNGDDVKMYGLFCEHTTEHQVVWRGERGSVTFFQCELPYDVDAEFEKGSYTGYYVDSDVKEHTGRGLGVYTNFQCYDVKAPFGFVVPGGSDKIVIENPFTVFLSNKGGIEGVIKVGPQVIGGEVKRSPNLAPGDPNPDQVKRVTMKPKCN